MTRVLSKSEEKEEEVENESEKYHSEEFFSNPFLEEEEGGREKYPILEILLAALRKSLLTCGVEREEFCSMDIGRPTNVKHVSHVTFDRFNGFLGLPLEFQPDLPIRVPSASARVFGVSAKSMQCSYDHRGNSVPTILLLMQRRLYSQGGLQAEGIFRINAENSQEEYVRDQLNNGIVPHGIDVHCLAGLIKAWFRELPTGVLDSLTPDQVMHCNTEEDCSQLVRTLPSTEAALLDWAINLMADVVHHEDVNKMNSRNIAMVFAPNMTQMADPLTALIHAVQVMNFLKTLIIKTQREREESTIDMREMSICSDSPSECDGPNSPLKSTSQMCGIILSKTLSASDRSESEVGESFRSFQAKSEVDEECGLIRGANSPPAKNSSRSVESEECSSGYVEGYMDLLSLRRGVRKLCRHPVFQFSKPDKKSGGDLQIVNSGEGGAWA